MFSRKPKPKVDNDSRHNRKRPSGHAQDRNRKWLTHSRYTRPDIEDDRKPKPEVDDNKNKNNFIANFDCTRALLLDFRRLHYLYHHYQRQHLLHQMMNSMPASVASYPTLTSALDQEIDEPYLTGRGVATSASFVDRRYPLPVSVLGRYPFPVSVLDRRYPLPVPFLGCAFADGRFPSRSAENRK